MSLSRVKHFWVLQEGIAKEACGRARRLRLLKAAQGFPWSLRDQEIKSGSNRLSMADAGFCCGSSPLRSSITLGVEMARLKSGVEGIFRSREKARYAKVQATGLFYGTFFYLLLFLAYLIIVNHISKLLFVAYAVS